MTAGYSGTPLPRKLGIKDGSQVLLAGVPTGFALTGLPLGVTVARRAGRGPYDVVLLFCPDLVTLAARFAPLSAVLGTAGALWACWPKRASGITTDITENGVRGHGLQAGLVDVKVAAIDDVWSGLKFVRRLADR